MRKDFHLVLSFDSPNEKLVNELLELMKSHAREIDTTARFVHGSVNDGSPKPEVKLFSDDFLMGKDDLDIKDAAGAEAADKTVDPKSAAT